MSDILSPKRFIFVRGLGEGRMGGGGGEDNGQNIWRKTWFSDLRNIKGEHVTDGYKECSLHNPDGSAGARPRFVRDVV